LLPGELTRDIAPGESASARMGGTGHHYYHVKLSAGQVLAWTLNHHGMNSSVVALTPDLDGLVDEDIDREPEGRDAALLVAPTDGVYTIAVKGESTSDDSGSYDLVLAPAREPTPADRQLYEALQIEYRLDHFHGNSGFGETQERAQRQAALAMRKDLVQRYTALGDRLRLGFALNGLCTAYEDLGDLDNALPVGQRAREIFEAEHSSTGLAKTLLSLANVAYYRGEILEAIRLDEQELEIVRPMHNFWSEAGTLANLGTFHQMLDEPQQELELSQQALAIWERVHNRRNQVFQLIITGNAYSDLGDADSALESYARAATLGGKDLDDGQRSWIERGQGTVYSSLLHQDAVALEHFRKSLALCEHTGNEQEIVDGLATLAPAYEAVGQHEAAIDAAQRGLERARKMKYQARISDLLSALGASELGAGRIDDAHAALDQAVTAAQRDRSLSQESWARGWLARMWRRRGDRARAQEEVNRTLALAEAARARVESVELRTGVFSKYTDYYNLYVDLLLGDDKPQPAQVAKAFTMHERSRARTLLELLAMAHTQLDRGVPAALVTARDEAKRVVKQHELQFRKLIDDGKATAAEVRAAEQALATAMRKHDAAEAKVRALAPRNAAFSDGNATVAELQARLPADATLLEYALGDEESHLWRLTAHSLDVTTLAPRDKIEAAARRYYELVTARSHAAANAAPEAERARMVVADRDAAEAARVLSKLVLAPVANRLDNQRLIIVADGALAYVPFAALPLAGDRALLEDHELTSLPSATVLTALARRAQPRAQGAPRVAVFADPVFDAKDARVAAALLASRQQPQQPVSPLLAMRSASDVGLASFRRLHFSRAEAQAIAGLTAPERSRIALDFAASRNGLADLHDFDILHFATHGILNSRHAELSGLVLSLVDQSGKPVDGFLRLHDIYGLDLNAQLVVLSACESALGKEIRGEGLMGLTQGFLYAGADRVLASLWQIDDKSTAELFAAFYTKLLREGARPSAALREAQLALLRSSSRSAPFYWAPFVLQGEVD
jgi:CHAT domain-containing protein/tetratricopeptide (TPR) repeat protein